MARRLPTLRTLLGGVARCRWGLVVALFAYQIFAFTYRNTETAHTPGSDGHYTWLFARSLVYDHDIDFKNDYALCGDPYQKNVDRGTGHPDNPFYVGPSIVLAPVLFALEHTMHLGAGAPEAVAKACSGPLTQATLAVGPWLGAWTVWIMYRLARRHAGDGAAALAAGLLGLGSSLPAYAGIFPAYSHVYDAFFAALTMLASVRAAEKPEDLWRWALAGVAVGLGLLQRPVSGVIGLVPALLAVDRLWGRRRLLIGAAFLLALGALVFGVVPQALVYDFLYGKFWVGAPAGRYFLQYGHAHPWLVVFAPHGGFLYVAPVGWLAVIGFVPAVRARATRALALGIAGAAIAVIWVSSAALDWSSYGTFGARRLTSLLPVIAPLVAIAIARAVRWLGARRSRALVALGAALLVSVAFSTAGAAYGLGQNKVTTERGLTQAELYGAGDTVSWSLIDDRIGDLAILPAELVYRLRYGVAMNTFREATEPIYSRNYRTMVLSVNDISLTDGRWKRQLSGLVGTPDGARMVESRSKVLFAAEWPFATHVIVRAHAARPTRIRVGRGLAFGRVLWFGDVTVGPQESQERVAIPEGGFDSGLMELVFECQDAPAANVVVSSFTFEDDRKYAPSL